MSDPYEAALRQLRADTRSLNHLERMIRVPAETLRDIRQGITKSPRYDTLKKLLKFYGQSAA